LDVEDIKGLNLVAVWKFKKIDEGFLDIVSDYGAQRACFKA
jgi:hypothetical protein